MAEADMSRIDKLFDRVERMAGNLEEQLKFEAEIETKNAEKSLNELIKKLNKTQHDWDYNINVHIPDLKQTIKDVEQQLNVLKGKTKLEKLTELKNSLSEVVNLFQKSQSKVDARNLLDIVYTIEKINGMSIKDTMPKSFEKWETVLADAEIEAGKYTAKMKDSFNIDFFEDNLRNLQQQLKKAEEENEKYALSVLELQKKIDNAQKRLSNSQNNQNENSFENKKKKESKNDVGNFVDDFTEEEIVEDTKELDQILQNIYKELKNISNVLGSIDDESGLPNIISQLDQIFKRLEAIQEKAGNGIFNVQLGSASDQSKIIDEKMGAKWTETYQRYMKIYDKIFKSISDQYLSPDTLFAKIYSMNPDQQNMDELKSMFGRNTILSLQDPKEQVRRLTEFFKYVQQIVDAVDDGADAMSQAVASVMSKSDNRVSTNFKAIESRVNKIRSEAMPDNESLEESLQKSIQEMAEAEAQAEDWQGNLVKILQVLKDIREAFEKIASIDLFNSESFNTFRNSLEDLVNTISTLNGQNNTALSNNVNSLSESLANEQSVATDAASSESNAFDTLLNIIKNVTIAVDEKSQAFTQEKLAVETAIQYEIQLLDELISKFNEIKNNAQFDFELPQDKLINQSIDNKTSAFTDEHDAVYKIVQDEIEILDQLKIKLDDICSSIENKITLFNTQFANLNQLVESFRAVNDIGLNEEGSDSKNNFENLESSLVNIIQLIEEKTNAFNTEGQVVDAVVGAEVDKLRVLSETIRIIADSISEIKLGDIDSPQWISDLQNIDANKINDISKSITELYQSVAGLNLNDSNLISSIDHILSKGKELENLVKVLAASKKNIQATKEAISKTESTSAKKTYDEEYKRLKRIADLKHEMALAEASGKDTEVLHAKYDAEIEYLKNKKQKLSKQSRNDLNREIRLIEKRYQAEEEAIAKIEAKKVSQNKKDNVTSSIDDQINSLTKIRQQLVDLSENTNKIMPNYINVIKDQIAELDEQISSLNNLKIDIVDTDDLSQLDEATKKTDELLQTSNKVKKNSSETINKIGKDVKIKNLDDQITDFLTKNTKLSAEFRAELNALQQKLRGGNLSSQDIIDIATAFADVKVRAKEAGDVGRSALDSISQRLADMNNKFIAHFFSFQDLLRYGRQAIDVIRDLDTQLVDLRKTTTMNNTELEQFYFESNDIAKKLGTTTSQIIAQAAAWSRLGYSTKEASESMAALSSKFAAISPGMSLDDATDGLVSTMKAFHVEVEDTERDIMDNVNRIGNTFATSNGEIMEMLKRSSAAMAAANNTIEETIALESAAVQITRNAETTGTAFRTISMRIRGFDEETEELSEDLKNITGDIADLTKTAKTPGGISVFEENDPNTYKSTYQILKDISEIWDELTDKQQAGLLEKIGGKRGAQSIADLLSDFSEVERAMDEMSQAAGSADKEMSIIEESLDYKINKLQQTWVGIMQDLVDRGVIGDIVDGLTEISEAIGGITKALGGLPQIIGTVVGAFATFKGKGFNLGQGVLDLGFKKFNLDTKNLKTYLSQLGKLGSGVANVDKLRSSYEKLSDEQKSLIISQRKVGKSNEEIIDSFKNGSSAGLKFGNALKGVFKSILSFGLNVAITAAISAAISQVFKLADACKNVRSRMLGMAKELGTEFSDAKKSVDDYKNEIDNLHEKLSDSNISQNDAIDARKRLLEIQDDLIAKYGDEAQAINNITNAIGGEVGALDQLTDKKWQEILNEFNNPSDETRAEEIAASWWRKANGGATNFDAYKNLFENQTLRINLDHAFSDELKEYLEALEDIKLIEDQYEGVNLGIYDLEVTGDNLQDIYDKLLSIQTLTKSYDDSYFTKNINKQVANIKQALEDGSELYNQFVLRDYIMNDNYFEELLQNATKFANDYTVAFSKGDEAAQETAKKNVEDTLKNVYANLDDSAQSAAIRNYFDKAFASFAAELKKETFEVDFKIEPNVTLAEDKQAVIDAIREFTTIEDVLRFNPDDENATEEQKNAYAILQNAAEQYGMQVDELISKLNELFNLGISNYSSERNAGLARKYEEANGRTIGGNGSLGEDGKNHLADTADLIDKLDSTDYRRFNLFDVEELQKVEDAFEQIKEEQSNNITEAEAFQQAVHAVAEEADKVEEAIEEIIDPSTIVNSVSGIATRLKPQFDELANAYKAIFYGGDNGEFTLEKIDNAQMESIRKTFLEIGNEIGVSFEEGNESVEKFLDTITSAETKALDLEGQTRVVQDAFNELATAYFYSADGLKELNEETADAIEQQMEQMGIVNAHEVIAAALEQQALAQEYTAKTGKDLVDATGAEIHNLMIEGEVSQQTAQEMALLAAQKLLAAQNPLSTAEDISQLANLIGMLQLTGMEVTELSQLISMLSGESVMPEERRQNIIAAAQRRIDEAYKNKLNVELDIKIPDASGAARSAGGKAGDAYKNAFEERVSKMNAAISAVGTLMGKKISAAQSAKDAAIKALNEEKEAAISALKAEQKEMQERIESEKKEIQARYEAEIKAIEDTIKAKQKEIEAFQAQIDAINKANEARERQLALQKAIYDMYRAENQRTRLVTIMYARGYSNVA